MLGLTCYKNYVGSNLGRQWKVFYEEGLKIGDTNAYFADPLGNQCIIALRDGNHVILNRSYQVAEGQGQLTCVGGHPEPSMLHIESYEDALNVPSVDIVDELFESMRREVHEETNIPMEFISEMYMIGVMGCVKTRGREIHLFCCFVDLDKQQVLEYYRKGPEDLYESLGINFYPLEHVIDLMVSFLLSITHRIKMRIHLSPKRGLSIQYYFKIEKVMKKK